ncbi:glycosyltransferase family 4 protein [Lacinutrix jangbogonensis]|uniref:glycosyltransferase family 4 protein n=1 Tax=Lacinutrix jangbogonensis TaxID=1469557 RepID=UPI00053DB7B2|nr:glycosyltransferase [Lacinutrix jangbogonensis]
MRFLIISHAAHKLEQSNLFSYAPYVREMNLWLKHVDEVEVIAPEVAGKPNSIEIAYKHENVEYSVVTAIQFTSVLHLLKSIIKLPLIIFKLFRSCAKADHIHLRCPGNMGLLGCFIQVFFPNKIKTAKYAGNWDPKARQPLSYRLQKWILSNTLLTKNMQVLVYGDWENQSKNIKPFFTATYRNSEIETIEKRDYNTLLKFVFVGSLVVGKRPLLAIQIIEALKQKGFDVSLEVFGDGVLRDELIQYISKKNLERIININGNQTKEVVKEALKTAHFSILPSKSEGWPKAIAEAMFFGCIPVVTEISCVPYMLDYGKRGILMTPNLEDAIIELMKGLGNNEHLRSKSEAALKWSQQYTLDLFENEIIKLLNR